MSSNAYFQAGVGAQVIDFAEARQRPAGDRAVERLRDGRRKGNHGNRASAAMRAAVVTQLDAIVEIRGEVTADAKRECAHAAGVDVRTVNRWWEQATRRRLDALREAQETRADETHGHCADACHDGEHARGCRLGLDAAGLPTWLYKFNELGRLQLTRDEIEFFASHTNLIDAIDAVHADPSSRLRHYATSTLYAAWANVSEPVRVGAKRGSVRQRAVEATYPLTGSELVNETWSIDEYDLKVRALWQGALVHPKVLIVRERHSGVPLAKIVLPGAATGHDTGTVLAAAAIGYTAQHPRDYTVDLRVGGVARYLVSDQGGPFIGEDGAGAARRLGIGIAPIPSHQPQANGDHEVMHQSLLAHFADGPGSRRGWTDRAGNRLDHGTPPFETVVDQVEEWFITYLATPYTKGPRAGSTRLEVYANAVDAGRVYQGHSLTEEDEAALATVVGDRIYDVTRGIQWDKRYWLSSDLANKAVKGQKLVIAQLLDPDVLYVFDTRGKFMAVVEPRAEGDVADQHGLYLDRARREAFVKRVATQKAADAVGETSAIWDETADGLADAEEAAIDQAVRDINDKSRAWSPVAPGPTNSKDPRDPEDANGTGAGTETGETSSPSDDERGSRKVARPVQRRRKKSPAPTQDLTADDDEEEKVARLLEAARELRARPAVTGHEHLDPSGGGDDAP